MSSKQIFKNLISAWISKLIKLVTGLFIIPVFISELGVDGYGLIIVLTSILSFSVLADFGIRASLVRYLVISRDKDNHLESNEYINTGFALYIMIFIILGTLLYIIAPWLSDKMNVSDNLNLTFINLLRTYGIISIFISFTMPVFSAINASNNRYDIVNYRQSIIGTVSSIVLLIAVKYFQVGINGWAIISVFFSILTGGSIAYQGFKQAPYLKFHPQFINVKKILLIFKFGGIVTIGGWSRMMKIEADPLIIASLSGVSNASIYRSGVTLPSHTRPLIAAFAGQLHTITTEAHKDDNEIKLHLLFEKGSHYTLLMGSIMMLFFLFFSDIIINVWLGNVLSKNEIIQVVLCVKAMAIVDFCFYIEGSSYSILYAKNHLKFMTLTDLCLGVLNLLSSFLLFKYSDIGVVAVIIPTIIIEGSVRPFYLYYTAKVIKYKLCLVWPKILRPSISIMLIICFFTIGTSQIVNYIAPSFWIGLIFQLSVFFISSLLALYNIGFSSDDRIYIKNKLNL